MLMLIQAAILLTVSGAANLVVLVVILPAVSWACLNYLSMSALTKDLWLARVTGIIQAVGAVMVAFSFTPSLLAICKYSAPPQAKKKRQRRSVVQFGR